jgi:kynureninase
LISREQCLALDAADRLAPLRQQFDLPEGVIYLDGNSLGVLPRASAARVQQVIQHEWGTDLIKSWNSAGWMDLPTRVGDKIARLVGAGPGELIAADSTSVNLFKVLSAALQIMQTDAPQRRVIVSERSNFPTDLYIAQSLARQYGFSLMLVDEADDIEPALNSDLAVLLLTEVNYRTGYRHDMVALTQSAQAAGGLVIWDLAHSAGALPVDLHAAHADFAVGCGYKYLNGGPGAPAFVWAHPRHASRCWQPLAGWMGHAAPFEFRPDYLPSEGIQRFLCGTPSILGMSALECGVDSVLAAEPLGGMPALRAKSIALSETFIALVDSRCASLGIRLVSPRDAEQRGSQVSLRLDHPLHDAGYAVMKALIARGVIGDYRAGDPGQLQRSPHILRFGFTPLYTRFVDVCDAVEQLVQVLQSAEWREPRFQLRDAVT